MDLTIRQTATTAPEELIRTFVELVVEYPDPELCTYKEYKGKPYYSIKYIENGETYIGYGTYKPEVLSQYLREYFMPSAQPEQRWIPCEERLPEEGQLVLTTIRGTDVIRVEDGETFEDAIDRSRKIVRVSVGFIGSDGWYGVDGYPEIVTPCAWMPLPEPYRKEGEKDE